MTYPKEVLPDSLFSNKDALVIYTYALCKISPYAKVHYKGKVIELKSNEALIPKRNFYEDLLLEVGSIQLSIDLLQQLDIAQVKENDDYYVFTLPLVQIKRIKISNENIITDDDIIPITVADYSEKYFAWLAEERAPKTLENAKRVFGHFNKMFGEKLLPNLRLAHLEEFKKERKKKDISLTTINMDIRLLKGCLKKAIQWSFLKENPFKEVDYYMVPKKIPVILTKEEFKNFSELISEQLVRDFFEIAFLTGMRRGEIRNLQWKQINFELDTITIQCMDGHRVKGGQARIIPLSSRVRQILSGIERSGDYVFLNEEGKQYRQDYFTKKFKMYIRAGGFDERLHLHCLRKSAASLMMASGTSPAIVRDILGHAHIQTTEGYSLVPIDNMRNAVESLSSF